MQQRFQNKIFFQIKDLRHPDDTSMPFNADVDDINFVSNPENVYTVCKVKKKEQKHQQQNCCESTARELPD